MCKGEAQHQPLLVIVFFVVCSMLAEDAIKAAVKDLEKKRTSQGPRAQQQEEQLAAAASS